MELTDKEKQLMTEGLVFSTSKPIPAFVKEGIDGGDYICQANAGEDAIDLCIYDLSLPDNKQNIIICGKPVEHIRISAWFDKDTQERKCNSDSECIKLFLGNDYMQCINEYEYGFWEKDLIISPCHYESLPLDVQAKRFFCDFIKVYIQEKNER